MRPSSGAATTARTSGFPTTRPNLSRAARRDVRRAAALANEANIYSFTIHCDGAVTWIPWREDLQRTKPKHSKGGPTAPKAELSERAKRSRARAAEHAALMQKARAFHARSIIRLWSRAATLEPSARPLPPPLPPPPPPPSPPLPTQPPPPQQQQEERMDDERAPKRTPSSPAAGVSPAEPRAKRRPLLPPPPSLPPSPPSSSPPSPGPSTPSPPSAKEIPQLPHEDRDSHDSTRGLIQTCNAGQGAGLEQASPHEHDAPPGLPPPSAPPSPPASTPPSPTPSSPTSTPPTSPPPSGRASPPAGAYGLSNIDEHKVWTDQHTRSRVPPAPTVATLAAARDMHKELLAAAHAARARKTHKCSVCRRDFPWLFNKEFEKCRTCDSMANYVDHALAEALVYLDEERRDGDGPSTDRISREFGYDYSQYRGYDSD